MEMDKARKRLVGLIDGGGCRRFLRVVFLWKKGWTSVRLRCSRSRQFGSWRWRRMRVTHYPTARGSSNHEKAKRVVADVVQEHTANRTKRAWWEERRGTEAGNGPARPGEVRSGGKRRRGPLPFARLIDCWLGWRRKLKSGGWFENAGLVAGSSAGFGWGAGLLSSFGCAAVGWLPAGVVVCSVV